MSADEVIRLIEAKRQAASAEGIEPYAVLLDDNFYSAVFDRRFELQAEEVIHDALLQPEHGGVLWWSQRDYEKAEEAWLDMQGC